MFLRNFTQLPTSPSSNSWWLDENVQYDLMESPENLFVKRSEKDEEVQDQKLLPWFKTTYGVTMPSPFSYRFSLEHAKEARLQRPHPAEPGYRLRSLGGVWRHRFPVERC